VECEEQNSHPLPLEVQSGLEPRLAYREWFLDEQFSCPETATFASRDLIWESAGRTSKSVRGPWAKSTRGCFTVTSVPFQRTGASVAA